MNLNIPEMNYFVDEKGYFGNYGGAYIPEMLYPNVDELRKKYLSCPFRNEKHSTKC